MKSGGFVKYYGRAFKIVLAFLAAWALVLFMGDRAMAFTGNELSRQCESNFEFCIGYVFGVDAGVGQQFIQDWTRRFIETGKEDNSLAPICYPDGVDARQMTKVIIKYLDSNPELLHYSAGQLVRSGLIQNFPCPAI